MMFHTFRNQDERRNFGGSGYIEIQFCRLPADADLRMLTAVYSIHHWQDDSLYVDDENRFYKAYSSIFDCGYYNDLRSGIVDLYGVNYYPPSCLDVLVEKIQQFRPDGHEILLSWIEKARAYNGFYILGI